jgi:hypothetical protein
MAFVIYDQKKIIPAPFISVQKEYVKSAGGTKIAGHTGLPDAPKKREGNIIGSNYTIQLSGTLVASMMGSPQIDGTFYGGSNYPDAAKKTPQTEKTLVGDDQDKQRFNRLMKMQQSLRWLFSEDGHFFEIDDGLGNEVFKCIIREVGSIEFSEADKGGNWTDRCEYRITLIADEILSSGHPLCPLGEDTKDNDPKNLPKDVSGNDIYLEEATENWSVEPQEEGSDENSPYTFLVNHQVTARGKRVYDGAGAVTSEAWEEAEKWVKTKITSTGGADPQSITSDQQNTVTLGTTGLNLSGYLPYNRMRSENVDEMEGSYSVSETFLLAKENSTQGFSLSLKASQSTGLTVVSLSGDVSGLDDNEEQLDVYNKIVEPNIKYENALTKFVSINLYSRAQTFATSKGITLNPTELSKNESHDKISGNISYSVEFDNRPINCISGARSESINVSFSGGEDVFAVIGVVGRANGPIMQDMNTIKQGKVSISIDATMNVLTYGSDCSDVTNYVCSGKPSTTSIIESLRDKAITCHPNGTGTATWKESDSESWNVRTGRYSRNTTYVIKTC